ncbi:glutamyl-tRNA reductase [Natronobiforma cellulositropha]|uniref:glutamyl-tRNA reductase n=1 Tax=Natronobiforma cellulositropha TaxID=1679076 RepID=UPI0021D6059B|nr:glutamyl-tRNA reductase [Natronobiforma cellulositropha]
MTDTGVVTSARVTHASGSVDDIAAASPESQRDAVSALCARPGVEEAYVLSTCNRVEAYVVTPDAAGGGAALETLFSGVDPHAVVRADHEGSLHHLLRVAAGLESVVVGEDQIIGQVRTAYEDARHAGGIGPTLETAVTKAIRVGERARTETAINDGIVSLGSAATRVAATELDLEGANALVVGAGEMGQLAARSLADAGVGHLTVANRTVSRARHLVDELDGDAETATVGLDALEDAASSADVIVAATGSRTPVLDATHVAPGERSRVVVDLGQPRDVCPETATVAGVSLYDLDDLESITEETRERRSAAAREVEALIDEEFVRLLEQYKRTRADAVIAAMYESAERVKTRELETACSRLEHEGTLNDDQREVLEAMADSLVGQLLAPPTKSLREAAAEDDWSTINTALQLFDPDFGPGAPPAALERTVGFGESELGTADDD